MFLKSFKEKHEVIVKSGQRHGTNEDGEHDIDECFLRVYCASGFILREWSANAFCKGSDSKDLRLCWLPTLSQEGNAGCQFYGRGNEDAISPHCSQAP